MQVPRKQHRKRRFPGGSENGCVRHRARYKNHVWSYDFVTDRTGDGRQLRLLAEKNSDIFSPYRAIQGRRGVSPNGGRKSPTDHEAFLRLFTRFEGNLRAYVASLLPTREGVDDVTQESSVVLWRKFADFDQTGLSSRKS